MRKYLWFTAWIRTAKTWLKPLKLWRHIMQSYTYVIILKKEHMEHSFEKDINEL